MTFMSTVNIHAAKTHLSRLIDEVAEAEEVVIANAGRPVARLVPIGNPPGKRVLGRLEGRLKVPRDFDASLPDDVLAAFEER